MKRVLLIAFVLIPSIVMMVYAEIPTQIFFQGRLTSYNLGGLTGDTVATFRLYQDSLSPTPVWEETLTIQVTNGVFGVYLGDQVPLGIAFDTTLYLGVQVNGFPELVPRGRLASVGSALDADRVDGLHATQMLRSDISDTLTGDLTVLGIAILDGLRMSIGASDGHVLTSDGSGNASWQAAPSGSIGGGGDANYVSKFTAPATIGNSAIYESGGKVGIGTTSPLTQFELTGHAKIGHLGFIPSYPEILYNSFHDGSNAVYISDGSAFSIAHDPTQHRLHFKYASPGTAGNPVAFDRAMVIRSDGHVGIGTLSPARTLSVGGGGLIAEFGGDKSAIQLAGPANAYFGGYVTGGGQGTSYIGNNIYYTAAGWTRPNAANNTALLFLQDGEIVFRTGTTGAGTSRMTILNNGDIGIGTSSPAKTLHVASEGIVLDNAGADVKLWGASDGSEHNHYLQMLNATGLGTAWGLKTGGLLVSDTYAYANPAKDQLIVKGTVGIGTSAPTSRLHVVGQIQAVTSSNSVNTIQGTSSGDFAGVAGFNSADGSGVYGYTESSTFDDAGVKGRAVATSGNPVGVFGSCDSPGGYGLFGAVASGGIGVYGIEPPGGGVYAIRAAGDMRVDGTLTKAAGSFKIDHPLDPDNRYLSHSFVESPDMMNVYNGNAVLDKNGEATIDLPDWFEALNRDFRYQLTCIGGFSPVYIAEEIDGNRFKIAGGKEGLRVSWLVTGIRHDSYAEANRIKVEEEKPIAERGASASR